MITLKIWHGPMRTELTLPLPDGKLETELVIAFHATPPRFVADEVTTQALSVLNGKEIDLDELNFLAKRMEAFIPYEAEQFLAAVQVESPSNVKDFINLSFNMERYALVQNADGLAAVGKNHLLDKLGGIPASEIDKTYFEQAGRNLLATGEGIPTSYGLLFQNADVPYREVYDGTTFPYYEHRGGVIAVAQLEYGAKKEYLYLPEDRFAVTKAARRLKAPSSSMCKAAFIGFTLDNPMWVQHLENVLRDEGISEANEFAIAFPKSDEGMEKLAAVAAYADVSDSKEIMRLAMHMDDFVFIRDAETDEDVGRYFVDFDSEYRASPELEDYIDFDALGNQISEDREGQFVEGGFVCMDSGCSLELILEDEENLMVRGM